MARRVLSISVLLILSFAGRSSAQLFFSGTEYGISLGGSQYFGDLNDKYGLKFVRPVAGVFLRYQFNPFIAARASVSATRIGYSDNLSDNIYYKTRNLSFESNIYEFAIQSEFNFTKFATGEPNMRFSPYLTGGVGVFYYNPYTELDGKRYNLRKIGTEGQNLEGFENRKYNSFSVCFPIGLGFKYWVTPGFNIGLEIADRLTFTDYIDDVSRSYVGVDKFPSNSAAYPNPATRLQDRSVDNPIGNDAALGRPGKQRGNSQTSDQYLYGILNLSFQLKVYRCPSYLQEHILE
jgi:hypothetical protein